MCAVGSVSDFAVESPQGLRKTAVWHDPNLDFMRSVAVLFVLVGHTIIALRYFGPAGWNLLWLGTLGVCIFFVHTSLVLMKSLERKPHTLDFYIRRIFRIYPLALVAIGTALLFHSPTSGTVDDFFQSHHFEASDILANCLLLQNFHVPSTPIVNVMWTLPFEVEMYLVLPVLFFLARRLSNVFPVLLFWGLAARWCYKSFPTGVNLPIVALMFLSGVIAYVGFKKRVPRIPASLFPLFLLAVSACELQKPSYLRGSSVCLVLGLALPSFREFKSRWIVLPSQVIARYSYGIYLSHPFGLVLGMYVLRRHSVPLQLLVEIVTVVIASVAAYHYIELPMITRGKRIAALAENYRTRIPWKP